MKKFFLSAVMAIAALAASAEQPVGGISLTPHLGLGYSIASPKFLDTFDGFVSSAVGVEATYKATDLFGVSLGLDCGYQQTLNEEYKTADATFDRYITQYTFSIPVLAQVHFGQFAVKAGIQPGWIISPETHVGSSSKNVSFSGEAKMDDNVNSFQLAVPVGICYSPSFPLQFDLRYNIPLTNYIKDDSIKQIEALGLENSKFGTIMLTVGYRFDLGR